MTDDDARPETGQLLVDVDGAIARVTFDNPTRRNALSVGMRTALPGVLRDLQADPAVRVVVLTGSGTEAFAAGADIGEFGARRTEPDARAAYDRMAAEADAAWAGLDKPVIALIRGWCLGAGLFAALGADIRIAADDSRLGVPAARLGLGVAPGAVAALAAVIGPAAAAEMIFTARPVTAAEAARIGLVNRVVPAGDIDDEVAALAQAVAANAPLTIAAAKAALRVGDRDPAGVAALVEACYRSADYREGQAAFAAKRPPRFRGL
jgi:enoyl-CoA hydratase/carnithine racemase